MPSPSDTSANNIKAARRIALMIGWAALTAAAWVAFGSVALAGGLGEVRGWIIVLYHDDTRVGQLLFVMRRQAAVPDRHD